MHDCKRIHSVVSGVCIRCGLTICTIELELDSVWHIQFELNWRDPDFLVPITQFAILEHSRSGTYLVVAGQVKDDDRLGGCMDLGFGNPVYLHLCGEKDARLLGVIWRYAQVLMNGVA